MMNIVVLTLAIFGSECIALQIFSSLYLPFVLMAGILIVLGFLLGNHINGTKEKVWTIIVSSIYASMMHIVMALFEKKNPVLKSINLFVVNNGLENVSIRCTSLLLFYVLFLFIGLLLYMVITRFKVKKNIELQQK
ncbi:MAG TPA: hypothetical protein VEC37_17670 [Bacillota bacterium]|nr:hypothetical protein [Bacillota bacterium]